MVRLPVAATPTVTPTTTAMAKPANRRNSVVAACSRKVGLPSCSARRANTAIGAGSSDGGAMPDAASPCHSARTSAIGSSADQQLGGPPRRHVVPTAIWCTGSAQATSQERSLSNTTSSTKPSTPMMTIMA